MANITAYLNQISSAVYGEEVRGSIVSALSAMNNGINVDLSTVQAYTERARQYSSEARTYSDKAEEHEFSAKGHALSSNEYMENARMFASSSYNYMNESAEILQMVRDLLDEDKLNNFYHFVREQIFKNEGYEIERGIEDSSGDPILDSNGQPISARVILDPVNFDDTFTYIIKRLNEDSAFWDQIFSYVLGRLMEETVFNTIAQKVLAKINYDTIFDQMVLRMGQYLFSDNILDNNGDQILDSDNNPIGSNVVIYTKL